MKKKKFKYKALLMIALCFGINASSCKKFIEIDPPSTSVNEGNVYQHDGTAISAVIGIYTNMSNTNFTGDLTVLPELSADNLQLLNLTMQKLPNYYQNRLLANDDAAVTKPWFILYPYIFSVNAAIEGLNKSKSVTPSVKAHLLGQVYFLRAFYYFYLTNFYGDVPLALTTDYTVNNALKRTPASQVYSQIIADLKQAQTLLPENYLTGDMINSFSADEEQRVTANRSAATALLARAYLYQKDWANAEVAASEVIKKSSLYDIKTPLADIFLKNSKETILALQSISNMLNTNEADLLIPRDGEPSEGSNRATFLTTDFMDSFQNGDQREIAWIGTRITTNVFYPYPAKYKALPNTPVIEQSILLRLGEQYLIRAEARIKLNKIAEGIADLNVLRYRATDSSEQDIYKRLKQLSASMSKQEALNALSYERRVEMFAECGHRWFDLKRSGQIDDVMKNVSPLKGGTWSSYKALFPIPADELRTNMNLTQNEGYTN
jgi:starch-binding outer membrane protein, SusD/RagB family